MIATKQNNNIAYYIEQVNLLLECTYKSDMKIKYAVYKNKLQEDINTDKKNNLINITKNDTGDGYVLQYRVLTNIRKDNNIQDKESQTNQSSNANYTQTEPLSWKEIAVMFINTFSNLVTALEKMPHDQKVQTVSKILDRNINVPDNNINVLNNIERVENAPKEKIGMLKRAWAWVKSMFKNRMVRNNYPEEFITAIGALTLATENLKNVMENISRQISQHTQHNQTSQTNNTNGNKSENNTNNTAITQEGIRKHNLLQNENPSLNIKPFEISLHKT